MVTPHLFLKPHFNNVREQIPPFLERAIAEGRWATPAANSD
jgi:hypothetical protein